jgi:hypothetical protein
MMMESIENNKMCSTDEQGSDHMEVEKLRKLYPALDEQQILAAKEKLDAYLAWAWNVYKNTRPDPFDTPVETSYD